jgi:hypothetical protein
MFIRVKKIGPYEYLYLVENAREGGRHVQRVIKALGRRDAVENSDLLDGLIASAARHSRRSIATVAGLEAQGIDYILGVRERSTAEVRTTVIDDDGVAVPLTIPRQKGETDLGIKDVVLGERRYVLARNPEQARKDAESRTAVLAGLERKLAQGDKALVGNAGYRRFLADPVGEGFTIDAAKVEAESKGCSGVILAASPAWKPSSVVQLGTVAFRSLTKKVSLPLPPTRKLEPPSPSRVLLPPDALTLMPSFPSPE